MPEVVSATLGLITAARGLPEEANSPRLDAVGTVMCMVAIVAPDVRAAQW